MDVVIVSWQGCLEKSIAIAETLAEAGGVVHIIHSQENALKPFEPGDFGFSLVNNEFFFGRKFQIALDIVGPKPFLLVQADAHCNDWAALLRRFSQMLESRPIGVWAPAVHHTSWVNSKVLVRELEKDKLLQVSQTDGIVIGFSEIVVKRLIGLDFSANNLGWGIDWAAIIVSMSSGQLVVRDLAVHVKHKAGSGYHQAEAGRQQELFLEQLTDSEKAVLVLLRRSHQLSRRPVRFAIGLSRVLERALSKAVSVIKRHPRRREKLSPP